MNILCVTLNTAIDRTYRVGELALGKIRKPSWMDARAGGKGVNVARVLRAFGLPARHLGTAGGANGRFIRASLKAQEIPGQLVPLSAESRLCLTFLDDATRRETVVNEPGGPVSAKELAAFRRAFARALAGCDLVVLSGSLPRGTPDGFYAELIEEARAEGIPACLDASGRALERGLAARPAIVAPNEEEFRSALSVTGRGERALARALGEIVRSGSAGIALLKRGAKGALLAAGGRILRAVPPRVDAISPIGSGDAFLAGFLAARAQGAALEAALSLAVACGAQNATVAGAGLVDPAKARRLARKAAVDEI